MPRGFVNRRDRFKWDNLHAPEGEYPVNASSVITEAGPTLEDILTSIHRSASGSVITVPDAMKAPLSSAVVTITAVQEGTGTPSAENIRPITGWNGVRVSVSGLNIFNPSPVASGYIKPGDGTKTTSSSWKCSDTYSDLKGGNAWKVVKTGTGSSSSAGLAAYNSAKSRVGGVTYGSWTSQNYNFTADARYVRGSWAASADNPIMIVPGSFDAPARYLPYKGTIYTASWQTKAGTVYGGMIDLSTGTITVTHGFIAAYVDESVGTEWISDRCVYDAVTQPTPVVGSQVLYPLAQVVTYAIDPLIVSTDEGLNVIFADCGDIALTYQADLATVVQELISAADTADSRSLSKSAPDALDIDTTPVNTKKKSKEE